MRPFLTFAFAKARFFTEFSPMFATFVGGAVFLTPPWATTKVRPVRTLKGV